MFGLIGAALVGVILAGIHITLLAMTVAGSTFFARIHPVMRIVGGMCLRMGIIALVVWCMLRLSINHLILMMIAFYATEVVIMIAYKGVR